MITFKCTLFAILASVILGSINERLSGWLDRVVEYQKKSFIDDLMNTPKQLKFSARLEKAPPGYVDSKSWDFHSVVRLLTLIRYSEGAAPVRGVFRRAFSTKRRDWPWNELQLNSLKDDDEWDDYYAEPVPHKQLKHLEETDSGVIVIENPVEAKLPSARISVALLKSILQGRAAAVREMPTTQLNISWPVTPKRSLTTKSEPTSTDAESTASTNTTTTTAESATNGTVVTPNNETANGTANNETANGTANNETANGTANNETANGTDNNETANGTANNETVSGTANNETAVVDAADANKTAT